jgi:hypothetical protein
MRERTLDRFGQKTVTRGPGFVKFFTRYLQRLVINSLMKLQAYSPLSSFLIYLCFREDAIKAFLALKREYKWTIDWSINVRRQDVELDRNAIFVGKINPERITTTALREKFAKYGKMELCQLVNRFPTGPSKCIHHHSQSHFLSTFNVVN